MTAYCYIYKSARNACAFIYIVVKNQPIVTVPSSFIVIVSPVLTVFKNSSPSSSIAMTFESYQIFASTIPLAARESICSEKRNAAGLMPIEHTV